MRTNVFTISKSYWDFVRRWKKYDSTAVAYLTPFQVADCDAAEDGYRLHWSASSGTWVQFRQQP